MAQFCRSITLLLFVVSVKAWSLPRSGTISFPASSAALQSTLTDKESDSELNVGTEAYCKQSWKNGFSTVEEESCYKLDGDFPLDLYGTFFQNGHSQFHVGDDLVMHPFDAAGMVKAITIKDGKAWFRNRYVRTPSFVEEKQKGRMTYRGFFGTAKNKGKWLSNIFDLRSKNVANTHVLYQNNQLFALWEGGRPFEMDPVTLETLKVEESDLNGTVEKGENYAAHYKIDSDTGHVVSFAIAPKIGSIDPNEAHIVTLYEHDLKMQLVQKKKFEVPGFGVAHDVAMTENYVCMFQAEASFDPLPWILGQKALAECLQSKGDADHQLLHFFPRCGGRDNYVSVPVPPGFSFHLSNAFEEENGKIVVVDVVKADKMMMSDPDRSRNTPVWESIDFSSQVPPAHLKRFRIDLYKKELLSFTNMSIDQSANVEFPAHNPQKVGKSYKYAYAVASAHKDIVTPAQAIVKIDVEAGKTVQKWSSSKISEFVSEFIFQPRPDAKEEDDGYLLGYLLNGKDMSTDFVVFDARDISRGPISRTTLRTNLSHSLHGVFVPGFTPSIEEAAPCFSSNRK